MKWQLAAFADEASGQLAGQIGAMKRGGVSHLEIRFVDGANISKIPVDKARDIRRQLDDNGLAVWAIGSPTGKIKLGEPFAPHFDEFRHQLELAHILGATHYRLFSFYGADDSAAAFDAVCERLSRMIEAARGSGVILCHENEKDIYGDTAPRCLQLHKALPALKAVFDPANFLQCGQETLAAWELLAPYVEYLHIKDCNAQGEVVPPGMGVGQLPTILAAYQSQGGYALTLEPHLSAFVGLAELENGAPVSKSAYSYKTNDEAFDAAVAALKALL